MEERNEIGWPAEWEQLKRRLYHTGVNRSYQGFVMPLDAVFLLRQETCMKAVFIETLSSLGIVIGRRFFDTERGMKEVTKEHGYAARIESS